MASLRNDKVLYFRKPLFFILLSSFILIFSFQNCSEAPLHLFSQSSGSAETSSENNGQGYNGKGYYRYVPEFTCEQNEAPNAFIEVNNTTVTITENNSVSCNATKKTLPVSEIDSSIYQNEVIGYQEGIFEGSDQYPQKIPSNLVEVWCKDRNDEQGIETLTHFDRLTNLAVNRTYYSLNGNKKKIDDFSVARTISNQTVLIRDNKGFELTVYRNRPAPQFGLFKAHLSAVIEGKAVNLETYCRLGGSLDPKIWPAKQIIDTNINFLRISPQLDSVAYTARSPNGPGYELYVAKMDGGQPKRVSKPMLGTGITLGTSNFEYTSDGKSLVYTGDERVANVMELFRVGIDGNGHAQLSPTSAAASGGIVSDFRISSDNSTVFFHNKSAPGYSSTLRGVSLLSPLSSSWIISPPTAYYNTSSGPSPTIGTFSFELSSNQSKVAFLFADTEGLHWNYVYVANNSGTSLTKYPPPAPFSKWMGASIVSISSVDYLVGMVTGAVNNPGATQRVVVPLNNTSAGVVFFPNNLTTHLTSPNGVYALLTEEDPSTSTSMNFFNLSTGRIVTLPAIYKTISTYAIDGFFSKDSKSFISQAQMSDGRYHATMISAEDGTVTELCPGVAAMDMKISEIDENTFLILNYNLSEKILDLYLKKAQESCRLVNRVPSPSSSMVNARFLDVSMDKQNILLYLYSDNIYNGRFGGRYLYTVPLNGHSPILINTPLAESQLITMARYLKDSKSIIYQGDQIVSGQPNLFFIKLP